MPDSMSMVMESRARAARVDFGETVDADAHESLHVRDVYRKIYVREFYFRMTLMSREK